MNKLHHCLTYLKTTLLVLLNNLLSYCTRVTLGVQQVQLLTEQRYRTADSDLKFHFFTEEKRVTWLCWKVTGDFAERLTAAWKWPE